MNKRKVEEATTEKLNSKILKLSQCSNPEQLLFLNQGLVTELHEVRSQLTRSQENSRSLTWERNLTTVSLQCLRRTWKQFWYDCQILMESLEKNQELSQTWTDMVQSTLPFGGPTLDQCIEFELPEWYFIELSKKEEDAMENDDEVEEKVRIHNEKWTSAVEEAMGTKLEETKKLFSSLLLVIQAKGGLQGDITWTEMVKNMRATTMELESVKDALLQHKKMLKDMKRDVEFAECARHASVRDLARYKLDTDGKGGNAIVVKKEGESAASSSQDVKEEKMVVDGENDERVQELMGKCAELEEELKSEKEKMAEMARREEGRVEHARVEGQLKSEIAQQRQMVAHFKMESERYLQEMDTMRQCTATLESKYHNPWTVDMNSIKEELVESQLQLTLTKKETESLTLQLQEVTFDQKQLQECETLVSTMKNEMAALKKQDESAEERGRKAQKAKMQTFVDGLSTKAKNLEGEMTVQKETIKALKATLSENAESKMKKLIAEKISGDRNLGEVKSKVQRREATIAKLTHDLKTAKENDSTEEITGLVAEIEALIGQLEKVQTQNVSLLEGNKTVSSENRILQKNALEANTLKGLLTEEMAGLRMNLSKAEESISTFEALKMAMEAAQNASLEEIKEMKELIDTLMKDMESNRASTLHAQNTLQTVRTQLEEYRSKECEKCLKWEKKETDRKVKTERARASGTDPLGEVERYELETLRKAVRCSVCQERSKEVVLSKCYHMFCKTCIDDNLRNRNRKCPTCKQMFGQDDVKSVWVS